MSDHRHHTWHWEQISSVKVKHVAVSQGSLQRPLTLTVWRQCPVQVSSTRWEVRARAGKVGSLPSFDPKDTSRPWSITLMTHTLPFPQSRTHTQTWTESVWPHLIYGPGHYLHRSRCGQHHIRFNQTNHPIQWHSKTEKPSLRCSECWVAFNREAHLKSMLFTSKWNTAEIYIIIDSKWDVQKIAEMKHLF